MNVIRIIIHNWNNLYFQKPIFIKWVWNIVLYFSIRLQIDITFTSTDFKFTIFNTYSLSLDSIGDTIPIEIPVCNVLLNIDLLSLEHLIIF